MKWFKRLVARLTDRRVLSRDFDKKRFQQRLAAMPSDDPLWPMLLELLDAFVLSETQASATPGLDDGEAHRFRGRIGMLLDLRSDLEKAWREAREKPIERKT